MKTNLIDSNAFIQAKKPVLRFRFLTGVLGLDG